MVPSPGNQNNDAVDDATNAVGESPSLTYDKSSNGSRPNRLSALVIFLSSWCTTRAINDCADEELTSDYHMWNQQHCDTNLLLTREEHRAASIAACFLKDYEDGRPPTLSPKLKSISDRHLQMYRFKHSTVWSFGGLSIATILLFVADGPSRIWTLILNMTAVTLFGMDLYMKRQLHMENDTRHYHAEPQTSTNRSTLYDRFMMYAVALFLSIFTIQSWLAFWLLYDDTSTYHPFTWAVSIFKPIVFFYQSRRARDAFEALSRIGKKLLRVILIELFLILTFAAVACRLFSNDENFQTLGRSWLSLFALSTTVVNPSIWMPAYNDSRWNAIFFVTFIVVGVFYLHSLVLSVVFQVFIKSATEVHRRSVSDKEQSLRLAYLALTTNSFNDTAEKSFVHPPTIREAFRLLRPHYSRLKTTVLMDIVLPPIFDTSKQQIQEEENLLYNGSLETKYPLSYTYFRNRIRQALTSSVRVARSHSALGLAVEVLGATGAICNLAYVILLTSKFDVGWFLNSEFALGSILTFAALVEAILRYNPVKFAYRIDPMSRLNAILDGTGTIGAIVSLIGIILKLTRDENGLDFLLTGRAIGMIQSMRFSVWFREVLQRSLYVLPLLSGPIFLVLSTMHVFVCCGMLLWSGSVDVDELSTNENVESLFYLNNFNSYGQGFITIFNVLVVNDWNQIANVFLYADRHSDPVIVYLFLSQL
ncbi:ion transport protein [Nitzschia inconspicua]|uniref:Ion transport protein n=1 Tax=Nitzschia inconspicua TaxID=303405 RepID=A0A9K3LUA2_9STRA|nr:ion transport protein [Nitzschia inconspicua]